MIYTVPFQVKKVPLLLELVPILISQGVRPVASSSDDDEGALPVESQLSLILLSCGLNHALQDQVSDLEFPNIHFLMVYGSVLPLVGRDADLRLLSIFLRLIQCREELGIVLVLSHSFHSECRHVDVDWDDRLCSVCQRE